MLRRTIAAAALSAIAMVTPALAQQTTLCGLRADMGRMLDQRFGERPQAAGMVGDRIVELLVSPTGSWTILITGTEGRACVVAGGEGWIDQPVTAPQDGKLQMKETR